MGWSVRGTRVVGAIVTFLMAALLGSSSLVAAQTANQPDVASEPLTILLMISDANTDPSAAAAPDAGASDVMAVVHLNPDTQACRALNILPDTQVDVEGVGTTRINQALATGGVELATKTVEDYLGIKIDHYAVIDVQGVVTAIDAVGGVTVNNPTAFSVGGNEFPAGEITLSGDQALLYGRYRENAADMSRLARQKALVEGLISSVGGMNPAAGVPASIQGSVADIQDHLKTDITLDTALEIAQSYSTCVPEEQTVETIMFSETTTMVDAATQEEVLVGVTDPANVEAHANWLINGGELPQQ
jgi:LCP family protein required for cell wall assembly